MTNLESHLDMVGVTRYLTVCDAQNAYNLIPVAASAQAKTIFVSQNRTVGLQTPSLWYSERALSFLATKIISFRTL